MESRFEIVDARREAVTEILDAFCGSGCGFVVIGSAAALLLGRRVVPRDVDVVADTPQDRARAAAALRSLGARSQMGSGWVPEGRGPLLGQGVHRFACRAGWVDVVFRLPNGWGYEELKSSAVHRAVSSDRAVVLSEVSG